MEHSTKSIKMLRQRKLLLVLPILILPFITLLFWILGGGKIKNEDPQLVAEEKLNNKLPDPNFEHDASWDKMNYYEQASLKSKKLDELIRDDPNYKKESFREDSIARNNEIRTNSEPYSNGKAGLNTMIDSDANLVKVHQKLEALQKIIASSPMPKTQKTDFNGHPKIIQADQSTGEVDRLEQMLQSVHNQGEQPDQELIQLSGMLENILDIQHPERVAEKNKKEALRQSGAVFTVTAHHMDDTVSFLENGIATKSAFTNIPNGFYSFDELRTENEVQNAISAVIHQTQSVVNGSIIKLRLTTDIEVNGTKIPKDNFLFGTATLAGERLTIKINSLRLNNSLFPVDLAVYDLDGLEGIYIPGAIARKVAKESGERSIENLGASSLNDSWSAQAVGVGIEATKSLLSKSVKLIKVVVKGGYQVLLRDEKQKDSN